jgi:hypothetical protein
MNPQTCTSPYGRSVGRRRWRRRRAGGGGEERRRRRREALGGGRRRTRGRGRGGAGRRRGGACGRRGCPGTASRSSRSSTCPAASPIPFRRLPFFPLPRLLFSLSTTLLNSDLLPPAVSAVGRKETEEYKVFMNNSTFEFYISIIFYIIRRKLRSSKGTLDFREVNFCKKRNASFWNERNFKRNL